MKHQSKPISISCFLFLLVLFSHSISITAQEVEDEREFDYFQESEKGPKHWGELHEEWSACNNGSLQSPIDLSNERVKVVRSLGKLKRSYKASNASVKNRGHDIMVEWTLGNAGSIKINGTEYFLLQCHWHSPSEHTINGRSYDMELHMVHLIPDTNVKNNILVIGLLYKIGHPDPFISKLMTHVESLTDQKEERSVGVIDPSKIKFGGNNNYYRYLGSLTVPPCTEGVIWIIHKKIRTVSREQINLFRVAVHDYAENNARPVQPHNLREIHVNDQKPRSINN